MRTPKNNPRSAKILDIVRTVTKHRLAGERVDITNIVAAHPDLMPELARELERLARIDAAARVARECERAAVDTDDGLGDPFGSELESLSRSLSGYDFKERLHHGGQGVVYRAIQRSTQRTVAVKVLLHGMFASDGQRQRFLREVELASRLNHPNIVSVFDSGVVHGRHYYAMEYVEGMRILDYAIWNECSLSDRLRLVITVCRAVQAAHQRGVIHRDLKPSNIVVDEDGVPHVLDFGLAKDVFETLGPDELDGISATGEVIGTLPYLSPEQARGEDRSVDVQSDVYALGVVLFKTLTDQFPYPIVGGREEVLKTIVEREPQSLRKAITSEDGRAGIGAGDISHDLEAVMHMALEKDKAKRYESAGALAADLDACLRGEAVAAKAANRVYLLYKTARRYRVPLAVAAAIFISIGATTAKFVDLLQKNETVRATGAFRVRNERLANTNLLRVMQQTTRQARLLRNLQLSNPQSAWGDDLKRLLHAVAVPVDVLKDIVHRQPDSLLESVRDPGHEQFAAATRWLKGAEHGLDRLAETLESESFAYSIKTWNTYALGTDFGPLDETVKICGAFVARAYLRRDAGDARGAVSDLTAARRLASDMADGPTMLHQDFASRCSSYIDRFLQDTFMNAFLEGKPANHYTEWVLAAPEVSGMPSFLQHAALMISQSVNDALVLDTDTEAVFVDLDALNDATEGFFAAAGALTNENRQRAREIAPDDVQDAIERFIWCARRWHDLPFDQLSQEIASTERLRGEQLVSNPVLLLFPSFGNHYSNRVLSRAESRALKLIAWLARFQNQNGRWPDHLHQAIPLSRRTDLVDPMSGTEFVFDIVNDIPRIRSTPFDKPYSAEVRSRCSGVGVTRMAPDDDRLTYFPGRPSP